MRILLVVPNVPSHLHSYKVCKLMREFIPKGGLLVVHSVPGRFACVFLGLRMGLHSKDSTSVLFL